MARDYAKLGGSLDTSKIENIDEELIKFKANDVSPLTLLNDDDSMTPIATKVDNIRGAFENIVSGLNENAAIMQEQADYVRSNSNQNVIW